MSLADAPIEADFLITTPGSCPTCSPRYAAAGVSSGRQARVLARYPVKQPRFVEVELDRTRLVTLPMEYAREVFVEPLCARGGAA